MIDRFNLASMSKAELLELNKAVCENIRKLEAVEKAVAIHKFSAGDAVWFKTPKLGRVNAKVEKVLRTNVDVIANNGVKWRIPANHLNLI